jgi:hypothetical protein
MIDNIDVLEKTNSLLKIKIYDYEKPIFRSIYDINFTLDNEYNLFPNVIDINFNDLDDEYVKNIIRCYLENYYIFNFDYKKIQCKILLKDLHITNNYYNIIQYLDYGKVKTYEELSFKIGRFTIFTTFIFKFIYDNKNGINKISTEIIDDNINDISSLQNILDYYLNNIFPKNL